MTKTFSQELLIVLIDKLIIGLLIAVAGYFFSKLLEQFKGEQALHKEFESLRDQTTLNHIQRQIQELYSPLLGLIAQSKIVFDIAKRKLPHLNDRPKEQITREEAETWRYFVETYFLPLNKQMADLIRTKIYLITADELPESFNRFLMHQAQFECLHSLWLDKGISSDEVKGGGWPIGFDSDVQESLTNLRRNYNEYLKRIEKTA
jgi:hypothetical protein